MKNNLENLYLISGRLHGADDDSVSIIEAPTQADAEEIFTKNILANNDIEDVDLDDETTNVYIICSEKLSSAIERRMIYK